MEYSIKFGSGANDFFRYTVQDLECTLSCPVIELVICHLN